MLTDAIIYYLEVNPAKHQDLLDFVRNHQPGEFELPENSEVFNEARDWYEAVRDVGRGRHVRAHDIPEMRAFGYAIYDAENKKTLHLYIGLAAFKRDFPSQVVRLFETPQKRRDFALLISQGKAPDLG